MKVTLIVIFTVFVSLIGPASSAQTLPYEVSIVVDEAVQGPMGTLLAANVARSAQSAGIRASTGMQPSALFRSDVLLETVSQSTVRTPAARMVVEIQIVVETSQVNTGRSHGSTYMISRGIGENERAAQMNALRSTTTLNQDLSEYFSSVADDIAAYFNSACTGLLANIERQITLGNHETARYALGQIPMSAQDCWRRAQPVFDSLVSRQLELQCSSYLIKARAQWASSRSRRSAQTVADRLVSFYPGSNCDDEVDAILQDVTSVIAAHDSTAARRIREDRDFRKARYYDALADRRADSARDYSLEESRLEAQKEVGMEMARSWAKADVSWVTVFGN